MLKQRLVLDYYTQIFLSVLAVIAGIVVARVAGPVVLGTLAFGMSFAYMFSFIPDFNIGVAHVKLVSSGEDLGRCNATFAVIRLITISLFLVFMFILFLLQKYLFDLYFSNLTQKYVVIIFVFVVAVSSLKDVILTTFEAKMEVAKRSVSQLLYGVGTNSLKIAVVLLGFGAVAISLSNLFVAILVGAYVLYLFKGYPFSKFDRGLAKKYFRIALPTFFGITVIPTVMLYADKVLLQYFANAETVGYYTVGCRLSFFISFIGLSFGTVFFPLASSYIAKDNYAEIGDKIIKFERFIYLFVMPVVVFIAVYAPGIVKIVLGPEYTPSVNVLSIATVAAFVFLLARPYISTLFSAGFFKEVTRFNFYGLIIFITAEYLFVSPRYLNLGAVGAVLALFISNLFLFVAFKTGVARRISELKIPFDFRYILYGIASLLLFYFACNYIFAYCGKIFKILFPLIYFLLTYASLYFLKLIEKADLSMLKSIINVRSMKAYTESELFGESRDIDL